MGNPPPIPGNETDLHVHILGQLIRISNLMVRLGASPKLAGRWGLTLQQWLLLELMYHRDGLPTNLSSLGRSLLVNKSVMTGMIDRLERDGYVYRKPNPDDRRVVYACLTPKGRRFVKEILPVRDEWNAKSFEGFSLEERQEFARLADRYFHNLFQETLELDGG
ncbi:MAG: MarR family winged helix-turn-helix transcriptional regulator [Nitrospinota bacterium]